MKNHPRKIMILAGSLLPMLSSCLYSFGSPIFLRFVDFSYWLNEDKAQRIDGRVLYSNDSEYFYCKSEGENSDAVITCYSYRDGSTSRSSFRCKDFEVNSSFLYGDSSSDAFFCQYDHKTLQSFDANTNEWAAKEMAYRDTSGGTRNRNSTNGSFDEGKYYDEFPNFQKDVRSPYYPFLENNETYLGSWFDENWRRKIPYISNVFDTQHIGKLGKIWFYGGSGNDIRVTYSIEDDGSYSDGLLVLSGLRGYVKRLLIRV